MKSRALLYILFFFSSVVVLHAQPTAASTSPVFKVKVEVTGVRQAKGDLRIGVYSEENDFASKSDIYDYRIVSAKESNNSVVFEIPKEGKYAIAILHDVSKNGKMDFNWVGYPKEPYGFSNNPGIWFRLPTFEECSFEVSNDMKLKVEL